MKDLFDKSLILGLCFIVGVLLIASVLGSAYRYKFNHADAIYVTGNALTDFESDIVTWRGRYTRTSTDLKTASQQLNEDKKLVENFLVQQGVSKEEIKFEAVDIHRDYEYSYDKNDHYISTFTGYTLSQRVFIESGDLDKVDNVSREISTLILQGVILTSDSPKYYFSGLEDLKLQLIAKASENAYQRASNIANESQAKLKKLIKSDMGVFQITGKNENESYAYGGTFNTSSRKKTANITVKNSYSLK